MMAAYPGETLAMIIEHSHSLVEWNNGILKCSACHVLIMGVR